MVVGSLRVVCETAEAERDAEDVAASVVVLSDDKVSLAVVDTIDDDVSEGMLVEPLWLEVVGKDDDDDDDVFVVVVAVEVSVDLRGAVVPPEVVVVTVGSLLVLVTIIVADEVDGELVVVVAVVGGAGVSTSESSMFECSCAELNVNRYYSFKNIHLFHKTFIHSNTGAKRNHIQRIIIAR